METPKTYKSAVDAWLAILLIFSTLGLIVWGLYLLLMKSPDGAGSWDGIILIVSGGFSGILIYAVAIPCEYTLSDKTLLIRSGRMREEIPLEKIKKASLTFNPLSAPAWSLKRIRIDLDSEFRLISPKDREGFIEYMETLRNEALKSE